MIVSEREAKVWGVAALAVFVWACTMVGCTSDTNTAATNTVGGTAAADSVWIQPAADFSPITLTLSDPAADTTLPIGGDPEGAAATDALAWLAPSQPDYVALTNQPEPAAPNRDVSFSGLSIAHPLLSAQRLLVGAVTALDQLPQPLNDDVAFDLARADPATRPIAAATALGQWAQIDTPTLSAPVELAGLFDPEPALTTGWPGVPPSPRSAPAPALAAAATADEAKFDSAGIIGLVLGGMVLLFGGEAVVLWMLNRRRAAAQQAAEAEEEEVSIFRLPEPIEAATDGTEAPLRKAA